MKYFKFLLLCISALFIVMLGLSLLIPAHLKISRAINLGADQDSVLNHINDLSQWRRWYPGLENVELDNKKIANGKVVAATAAGISLKILQSNDSLVAAQIQKSAKPVNIFCNLIRYNNSDSLTLQSYMEFDLKWYPWEKLSGLLFDKTYGPVMEQGLKNLKNNFD